MSHLERLPQRPAQRFVSLWGGGMNGLERLPQTPPHPFESRARPSRWARLRHRLFGHAWGRWRVMATGRYQQTQEPWEELRRECKFCGLVERKSADWQDGL